MRFRCQAISPTLSVPSPLLSMLIKRLPGVVCLSFRYSESRATREGIVLSTRGKLLPTELPRAALLPRVAVNSTSPLPSALRLPCQAAHPNRR